MENENKLADLQTAVTAKDAEITALKAKLASAESADVLKGKDAEITKLKGQITTLEAKVAEQTKLQAKAAVDAAIRAGKLAPQATELHAKWAELIAKDPANQVLLDGLPENPAFKTIIQAGAAAGAGLQAGASGGNDQALASAANQLTQEYMVTNHCAFEQARNMMRAKRPDLFGV
jgi:hypothetical protein